MLAISIKLVKGLVAVIETLTALAMIVAVVLNFVNIVARYVFSAPIASAEEVMLFLLVGIVFLGNSVVGWEGKQIRMDVVIHALPVPVQRVLDVIADLAVIGISIVLVVLAWPVIDMLAEFDQRSQSADIPLAIPQALVPIGLGLMVILVAARLLLRRQSPEKLFAERHAADVS
jgi:C4-dicarboxylate transporter DctQ subunit